MILPIIFVFFTMTGVFILQFFQTFLTWIPEANTAWDTVSNMDEIAEISVREQCRGRISVRKQIDIKSMWKWRVIYVFTEIITLNTPFLPHFHSGYLKSFSHFSCFTNTCFCFWDFAEQCLFTGLCFAAQRWFLSMNLHSCMSLGHAASGRASFPLTTALHIPALAIASRCAGTGVF